MSANISCGLFQRFGTFLQDHHLSFANCLLVVLTLGGEQAFRNAAFKCPCNQPNAFAYGLSFLIGPAFILLVIGILVNNLTWKLCQGYMHRSPTARHGFLRSSSNWIVIIGRAIVAPAAWIFVALLDGNYYLCLMSKAPCAENSEEKRALIALSQIISWLFLASVVATAFVVIICARCTDRLTFHHRNYLSLYRATERQILEEQMKEKATELAKSNVSLFLGNDKLNKRDWDRVSMAPPLQSVECESDIIISCGDERAVSSSQNDNKDNRRCGDSIFYSPLHRWASHQQQRHQTEQQNIKLSLLPFHLIKEKELNNDSAL